MLEFIPSPIMQVAIELWCQHHSPYVFLGMLEICKQISSLYHSHAPQAFSTKAILKYVSQGRNSWIVADSSVSERSL